MSMDQLEALTNEVIDLYCVGEIEKARKKAEEIRPCIDVAFNNEVRGATITGAVIGFLIGTAAGCIGAIPISLMGAIIANLSARSFLINQKERILVGLVDPTRKEN